MSLPWSRKSLRLQLAADTVFAAAQAPGRKGGTVATAGASIPAEPDDALRSAIDAVFARLGAELRLRGTRLQVDMADSRVHMDVVAGDYRASSHRQLQAIAEVCVAEMLGDAASGQSVRWQLQADQRHLLICALSRSDIDTVIAAAQRHGLKLTSLQPEFGRQWNRHAHRLHLGSGVFAVSGDRQALIARSRRGVITALSSGAWPGDDTGRPEDPTGGALDAQVDRLLAGTGEAPGEAPSFVLVAPAASHRRLASRWIRVDWMQDDVGERMRA